MTYGASQVANLRGSISCKDKPLYWLIMTRDEKMDKESAQEQSPQSVMEVAAAAAVAKIFKMGYDEYKDSKARALEKVDPTNPLSHIVHDVALLEGGGCSILLNCENRGVHGVYIDRIGLVEPSEQALQIDSVPDDHGSDSIARAYGRLHGYEPGLGYSSSLRPEEPAAPLPQHLPGGESLWVIAVVPSWSDEQRVGKLEVAYTVLGTKKQGKPNSVEFTVPGQRRS